MLIAGNKDKSVDHQNAITGELSPGVYTFEIENGENARLLHDPVAYVWLRSSDGRPALLDAGGHDHANLWHKLNGFNRRLKIEVKEKALFQAMCTEREGYDSKGNITIRRLHA